MKIEIRGNYLKVKQIKDPKGKFTLPGGKGIPNSVANKAISVHVRQHVWDILIPTMTIDDFTKYEKIYLYTEAIRRGDDSAPQAIKDQMLFSNAESFIDEYNQLFRNG